MEDRAVAAGLHSVALNSEGEVGYFGLTATNSTDNQKAIQFFQPERQAFLEYDLTKLIYALANPKKRVVGVITALPLDGGTTPDNQPIPPWLIMRQMREFFDVRMLGESVDKIPSDVDVLLAAEPYDLTSRASYAIDQYVLGGGKALVLVDPVPEASLDASLGQIRGGLDELKKILNSLGRRLRRASGRGRPCSCPSRSVLAPPRRSRTMSPGSGWIAAISTRTMRFLRALIRSISRQQGS